MPLIPALSRKRRPSFPPVPSSVYAHKTKFPKLLDGTTSQSLESTSTGNSRPGIRVQVKKTVSEPRSKLGLKEKSSDGQAYNRGNAIFGLTEAGRSTYTLVNNSNNTTVYVPLGLHLTAEVDEQSSQTHNEFLRFAKHNSAPTAPSEHLKLGDDDSTSLHALLSGQRSPSLPGLRQRLSKKFRRSFGTGQKTVVKKAYLRARPSMQAFTMESLAAQSSSTPSTTNSSGSLWGTQASASTLLTSGPTTPRSILRYGSHEPSEGDRLATTSDSRFLTPIPEASTLPTVTIKTVEAAAAAKMHLELRYNDLLGRTSARQIRRHKLANEMHDANLSLEAEQKARAAWQQAETDNLRRSRVLMNTTNKSKAAEGLSAGGFEVVSVLGKGSFGVVRLVRTSTNPNYENRSISKFSKTKFLPKPLLGRRRVTPTSSAQVYAMKVIRKSDMVRNGQEGHLRAERDFLVAAEGSRWIIPLIASFQDGKHLYLVMEYCIGGDFLGLLIRRNILSEEITRFYIAEMILCVEEAHRLRWIHRDVKPDNFLIACDGHLKISDFGLAFDGC
jgi:hypothetical protein